MDSLKLFEAALGLTAPWKVDAISFDPKAEGSGAIEIRLAFPRGTRFTCPHPGCGEQCPVHDAREQRWRHLNFFQYKAFLVAPVPRTKCPTHGVLTFTAVSWAKEGSGFTLLFEALVLLLGAEMPMLALARMVDEHDTRLWRVVERHVEEARAKVDMSQVKELVVDETSRARGHDYVTLFVEPGEDQARVLHVANGRSGDTFKEFCAVLEAHGGAPERIRDTCMDMSEAFQKGAKEHLPKSEITFDRFHVVKLVGEALDEVRRLERSERPELKNSRYHWLKNPENLTQRQAEQLLKLKALNLKTGKAYQMKLNIQEVWRQPNVTAARQVLRAWCSWVVREAKPRKGEATSGLEPMLRVARTVRKLIRGILNYFRRRLTSGVIEGINSFVQAARARARGYRSPETFKTMIYLLVGRLQFSLPSLTHNG